MQELADSIHLDVLDYRSVRGGLILHHLRERLAHRFAVESDIQPQ